MKRTFLFLATIAIAQLAIAQTKVTFSGVIITDNKGTATQPAPQSADNSGTQPISKKITNESGKLLPKGTYSTPKGSIVILPNYNAKKATGTTVQSTDTPLPNTGGLTDNNYPSLIDAPLNGIQPSTNTTPLNANFSLPPLTGNASANNQQLNNPIVNQNLPPLTSLTTTANSTANTVNQASNNIVNNYQPLPPLTALPATTYSAPNTNVIGGAYTTSKFNDNNSFGNNNAMPPLSTVNVQKAPVQQSYSMPPLASIEGQRTNNVPQYSMPPLASIEGQRTNNTSQYSMPALASIEGQNTSSTSQTAMPALAPIEGYNNAGTNNSVPELAPIKTTNLKGFSIPKGTTLNAKTGTSYIVKPLTQAQLDGTNQNEKTDTEPAYKPGAGGGMGMPALAPIEQDNEPVQEINPPLAPIETTTVTTDNTVPELAPIAEQNQQPVLPRKQLAIYQPQQKAPVQPKPVAKANPCIHTDGTYCPCCVQKPATKWAHKKKWTPKRTYRKPAAPTVIYVYQTPPPEQQPQQPVKAKQRVVYVPAQQQTYQQPQPQQQRQVQPVQQPVKQQEKVVYTDYTKVYYKEPEKPNCNCNQNASSGSSANNPQKYYDPAKYKGLVAGPTSGDYPANTATATNEPLKYTFYVNNRGKYSVGVYNQGMTVLVGQNGIVQEYRVNGDQDAANKPKVNYFGKPESVGGVPIVYNYNRSVNSIGNIKFEYDFEGFLKNVGSSTVLYNSRSNIASVDGVNVQYDGRGYVTGVDSNNGLLQYNSN